MKDIIKEILDFLRDILKNEIVLFVILAVTAIGLISITDVLGKYMSLLQKQADIEWYNATNKVEFIKK